MIGSMNLIRDVAGNNTFGLPFADEKYNTTLLATVEQTLDVPTSKGKWLAIFSVEPGSEVWVANNTTAAVPGAAFAATDSELNPVAREVKNGDTLHFITSNVDARVGVTFYPLALER